MFVITILKKRSTFVLDSAKNTEHRRNSIPDEDLFHFRLFSRITITIRKGYEKKAYTHVLKILYDTGILMIYLSPTVEVI